MDELSAALAVAIEAAGVAREILLKECALAGGHRGAIGKCPADEEAEVLIRERLLGAFPTWGFLGEETGARAAADGESHVWVVDPNDGTSSMQRGWRGHAVSIAVVRDGVPELGVVHAVDAPDDDGDLLAWAEGCGPVCRNGVPIERATWPSTMGVEDVVCLSIGANRNPVGNLACVAPGRYEGVPSIAYRLALVAAGDFAATVSLNPVSAWDIAAGHALLRGAGGVLVDENGLEIRYARDGNSVSRWVFGGGAKLVEELRRRPWETAGGSGFGEAAAAEGLAPVRPRPDRLVHDSGVLRRAQGCLLGQLAGDSLGALVEFASAGEIERWYPDGGPRLLATGGPHDIMAGQPTDDSELALVLARQHVARDGVDQRSAAHDGSGRRPATGGFEQERSAAQDASSTRPARGGSEQERSRALDGSGTRPARARIDQERSRALDGPGARSAIAGFEQERIAAAYAGWYQGWTHAEEPGGCRHRWCLPFDVGGTTARALGAVRAEDVLDGRAADAAMAAASSESQANGALMRVSPLGIWGAYRAAEEVAEAARLDARLTHPHVVCQDASAVFAVTLAAAIRRGLTAEQTYGFAVDWARAAGLDASVRAAIDAAKSSVPLDFSTHQGWVLIALQNAFFRLLHATSLEDGVVQTVRAGGDTDTNAAICGALLGAVHGREAVPPQWRRIVLSCRPFVGHPGVEQPRPAVYWPTDALILAERLLAPGGSN